LPKDLPLVCFDAVLIERVLANLLENAAKYTPPGSRILIEAAVRGTQLEVAVADNGPGLAPGSEETVFEKFTRGRTESATPGMGLGLAICRAIVEAHRGRIQAHNEPQGGVRFTFFLPLGTPPEPPAATDDAGAELQQAAR
jgi:two-component system sensor histidine kinase KdpD